MKRFRQNERLINNPLVRMLAILIHLVRLLNSYFHSHFASLHFWVFCHNMIFPSISPTDNGDTVTIFTSKKLHTTLNAGILPHYALIIKKAKEWGSISLQPSFPFVSTFLHTILPDTGRCCPMLFGFICCKSNYNELPCQSPISTIVLNSFRRCRGES